MAVLVTVHRDKGRTVVCSGEESKVDKMHEESIAVTVPQSFSPFPGHSIMEISGSPPIWAGRNCRNGGLT